MERSTCSISAVRWESGTPTAQSNPRPSNSRLRIGTVVPVVLVGSQAGTGGPVPDPQQGLYVDWRRAAGHGERAGSGEGSSGGLHCRDGRAAELVGVDRQSESGP